LDAAAFRESVAILGPGLLGGSIALALRRACPPAQLRIAGFNPDEIARARALRLGELITDSPGEAVHGAEIVVLCTPIDVMPALAREIAPHLGAETLVTDVGSVKRPLVAELSAIFGARYVGAHPMAGSEHRGLGAAKPDLFDGAVCFLIPGPLEKFNARAVNFWRALGCRIANCTVEAHDEIVARVSHLPHVVAAALLVGAERFEENLLDFSGPGLRDTTRLASGPPDLWRGILAQNREAIRRALVDFRRELERVEALLAPGRESELRDFLASAAKLREQMQARTRKTD
jgi:prephenate dehydrogenase